jgi:hypothetical protein
MFPATYTDWWGGGGYPRLVRLWTRVGQLGLYSHASSIENIM